MIKVDNYEKFNNTGSIEIIKLLLENSDNV